MPRFPAVRFREIYSAKGCPPPPSPFLYVSGSQESRRRRRRLLNFAVRPRACLDRSKLFRAGPFDVPRLPQYVCAPPVQPPPTSSLAPIPPTLLRTPLAPPSNALKTSFSSLNEKPAAAYLHAKFFPELRVSQASIFKIQFLCKQGEMPVMFFRYMKFFRFKVSV